MGKYLKIMRIEINIVDITHFYFYIYMPEVLVFKNVK